MRINNQMYDKEFFQEQQRASTASARQVVPLVVSMVQPQSVIDIGCGVGAWLSVCEEYGVKDILGVDGDYVDSTLLMIEANKFVAFDLNKPYFNERQFDLAICLEVAEHLPAESAQNIVSSLTCLSPIVLFSAAVPHQGGVHHVNEQWQSYWAELFSRQGYIAIDSLRPNIWDNKGLQWFYAQNMLLYVRESSLSVYPILKQANTNPSRFPLDVVHPGMYLGLRYVTNPDNIRVGAAGRLFVTTIINAIKRRLPPVLRGRVKKKQS